MAMSVGSGSGLSADINVTPMIDILLVLLIIFLIIQPRDEKGLDALIPQPPTDRRQVQPDTTIIVQVERAADHGTTVRINNQPVTWQELPARLKAIFDIRAEKVMFVRADPDLDFQDVAAAIDAAHGVGVDKVGLITRKIELAAASQ